MRPGMPEALRLAESLANSLDVETGADDLDGREKAAAWLRAHGLGDHEIGDEEVRRLRAFRSGLRALLLANHGEAADRRAIAALNNAAGAARLVLRFDEDGAPYLEAAGSGLDGVFASVMQGIAASIGNGTWERLKICRNDACAVAFYDLSKNRSRAWCSMSVCGNRMKVRSFRRRHASTGT